MNHIVWKAYRNFEKEEKWLNEMSRKGMALTGYSWCRYVFTDAPDNEYIYRIELLKHLPTHPESIDYIRFLEESGIECVATYWRWMYLRKKSSDGAFEVYSDIKSKIKHYKRVCALFGTLAPLNLFILLLYSGHDLNVTPLTILTGFLTISFSYLEICYIRKIRKLKKELLLYE